MAMHASGDKGGIFGEINITPLTDIFLVLLIIMMVVAPMIDQSDARIKLPDIENGQPVEQNRLTVEVTADGKFYLKGENVADTALSEQLKASLPADAEEKNVVIKADKQTKSGVVMKVLEAARDAGFEKVTVSGEALTDARRQQLQQQPQP